MGLDNAPTLTKMTEGLPAVGTLRMPDVKIQVDKPGTDFLSDVQGLVEKQKQQADEKPGLRLDMEIKVEDLLGPGEKYLRQAKELMDKQRFEEAIRPLDRALAEVPGLHEAAYLKALCLAALQRFEVALGALAPLRKARLSPKLATRVRVLGEELQARLIPVILLENVVCTETGQYDVAARRLRHLLSLDPDFGLCYYLLAGTLLMAGRLEEACAAVAEGLPHAKQNLAESLRNLRAQIDRTELEQELEPARQFYRKGNYARARSALERVSEKHKKNSLCTTFGAYLEDLGGALFGLVKGKNPREVKPRGRGKDVDALHFFLVREEIFTARALLRRGDPENAENAVEMALALAPHFPYAHYLLGVAIYRGLTRRLAAGRPPAIDVCAQLLEAARTHAQLGAKDPDITDVQEFIQAVDNARAAVEGARKEIEARREEARRVNAAIEEFKATMDLAGEGIRSVDHYRQVRERLGSLREQLPSLRKAVRTEDGKQVAEQLTEVVERNWKQLEAMRDSIAAAEIVNELGSRFTAILERFRAAPFHSLTLIADSRRDLRNLRGEVQQAARSARDAGARKALQQLEEAIGKNLDQLDEMERQQAEAAILGGPMLEFQQLMERMKQGFKSRDQVYDFASGIRKLQRELPDLERKLHSSGGRQALRQLTEAVENVARQLDQLNI
jgi:tetratricopeptide (TPR) repeat protein